MLREAKNQSKDDLKQFELSEIIFNEATGNMSDKIDNFPRFATRQAMAKFLARYEIFKKVTDIHGSIVECGVLQGSGLFTFAKLSSILEPVNHTRRIIGFDTFEGFPHIHNIDKVGGFSDLTVGGLKGSSVEELNKSVMFYDANRPIAHIPKIELVKGDICKSAPEYVLSHPHLIVSLLYLDLDLYEPTKAALEAFLPLIPKGGIIVFDELNAEIFPGETRAVDEVLGIHNIKLERFYFDSYISYYVKQ